MPHTTEITTIIHQTPPSLQAPEAPPSEDPGAIGTPFSYTHTYATNPTTTSVHVDNPAVQPRVPSGGPTLVGETTEGNGPIAHNPAYSINNQPSASHNPTSIISNILNPTEIRVTIENQESNNQESHSPVSAEATPPPELADNLWPPGSSKGTHKGILTRSPRENSYKNSDRESTAEQPANNTTMVTSLQTVTVIIPESNPWDKESPSTENEPAYTLPMDPWTNASRPLALQWNANGITQQWGDLQLRTANPPLCLAIQETHFRPNQKPNHWLCSRYDWN